MCGKRFCNLISSLDFMNTAPECALGTASDVLSRRSCRTTVFRIAEQGAEDTCLIYPELGLLCYHLILLDSIDLAMVAEVFPMRLPSSKSMDRFMLMVDLR
ncbi:hypothetical protein DPMN_093783 [Dreissena polymorpha]|uniref:Uncharacterized protein n=1 Tax=Dreissena polymorpha TaxID=45954 RepID=A0A9D4L3X3_DREPO|nr:hypothetical protein DPMN_093783 [Dreissena polymorpha]